MEGIMRSRIFKVVKIVTTNYALLHLRAIAKHALLHDDDEDVVDALLR